MNQLKQYFSKMSGRERRMVLSGVAILLLLVIYQSWESFNGNINKLQKRVDNQQEILGWMKQAANEVKTIQQSQHGKPPQGKQLLLSLVDNTIKQNKLGSSLQKVQPEGQQGVQVWLENASFENVIIWLDVLQFTHGFGVKSISIEGQEKSGIVNVRALIQAP